MSDLESSLQISGLLGKSASREVFLGFASSRNLHQLSYADVLEEETGRGYQRNISSKHSLDFRNYIQLTNSSTIPLTFNLRPDEPCFWSIERLENGQAKLNIEYAQRKALAQVDCQHRLGHLADLDVMLPFMTFIGLTIKEEMEIFNVINGKSKGLSASLLDYHDAQLASNLAADRPELFVALHLNDDANSPWYKQLDLGGRKTSGMKRRASLRTMQKAVKRFLSQTKILDHLSTEDAARVVREYWRAVSIVLEDEWNDPRKHFITKGIGVYALMGIAGDIVNESFREDLFIDKAYFSAKLADFVREIDWSHNGPLKGLGGESGAQSALDILRFTRRRDLFQVIENG
jgi:DNA sulfur modification protein DndB